MIFLDNDSCPLEGQGMIFLSFFPAWGDLRCDGVLVWIIWIPAATLGKYNKMEGVQVPDTITRLHKPQ